MRKRLATLARNFAVFWHIRVPCVITRFVCSLPPMSDETVTRCCVFAGVFAVASVRLWS